MIIFRADVSLEIGTGHISRCLSLAKELRKQGHKCVFVCRDNKDNLFDIIKNENFELKLLPILKKKINTRKKIKNVKIKHSHWLKKGFKKDAEETIKALSNLKKIDWLIVDHYGIDKKWEKKLRTFTKKILVIDDLANRHHDCDILINQNLTKNFEKKYNKLVPKNCEVLLGPKYALLQEEYQKLHNSAPIRKGEIKNILIYFGGSDHKYLNELTLESLLKLNRKNINYHFVVNSTYQYKGKIFEYSKKNKRVKIYSNLKTLAFLILKADIAIGACGVSSWERCCLGLPSIVITIAGNQKSVAKELNEKKLINWVGHHDTVNSKSILKAVKSCINRNLEKWSRSCKLIVDGYGTKKVASILTLNKKTNLNVRYASQKDEKLLLNWANDPLVRANAFKTNFISKHKHKLWFNKRLKSSKLCKILLIQNEDSLPVGQVRIEKKAGNWFIDFSLANFARKNKLGTKLLSLALSEFEKKGIKSFYAEVKSNNLSSLKAFERAGFKKKSTNVNFITYIYTKKL